MNSASRWTNTWTSSWTCPRRASWVCSSRPRAIPKGFRAALRKAADRGIPIVALKVGRTEKSAALTVSHSGAMAGDDATYEALFDRYGVQRARDQDEFTTMLIMFAELHPVGRRRACDAA